MESIFSSPSNSGLATILSARPQTRRFFQLIFGLIVIHQSAQLVTIKLAKEANAQLDIDLGPSVSTTLSDEIYYFGLSYRRMYQLRLGAGRVAGRTEMTEMVFDLLMQSAAIHQPSAGRRWDRYKNMTTLLSFFKDTSNYVYTKTSRSSGHPVGRCGV